MHCFSKGIVAGSLGTVVPCDPLQENSLHLGAPLGIHCDIDSKWMAQITRHRIACELYRNAVRFLCEPDLQEDRSDQFGLITQLFMAIHCLDQHILWWAQLGVSDWLQPVVINDRLCSYPHVFAFT